MWNIHGKIYDLTDFALIHPGGKMIIESCKGNDDIIKCCIYMNLTEGLNNNFSLFINCLCHNLYYLVTFFLFATVFLLPFLVLELFLVLCPLRGSPFLCLIPLYEPMSINLLILI